MVKKAINTKAKASLQPSSGTREINSRYPKKYKPLVKKDKNDANQEHRNEVSNKDKDIAKFHNLSFANSQPQTQISKKHQGSWQEGYPATGVNATKVAKYD